MRYKIEINLLALYEMKSKISLEEAVLLDYLYWLCTSPSEEVEKMRIEKDDKKYTWFDYEYYIRETPILRGKSKASITPKIRKLEEEGFIETINYAGENDKFTKKYVRLLPKVDGLFRKLNKVVQKTKQPSFRKLNIDNNTNIDNNNMSDKPTFSLKEEINKLLTDKRRHIQIIGLWIQEMNLKPENQEQIQSIIHRNVRPANLLKGYKNEDIQETIKVLKRTDYLKGHFGLETISKYIDEIVANKKKQGPKIVKWVEIKSPDGQIKMKPIYQ